MSDISYPKIRWTQLRAGTYPWPVAMVEDDGKIRWQVFQRGQNGGPALGKGSARTEDEALAKAQKVVRQHMRNASCQTCFGGGCYYCDG